MKIITNAKGTRSIEVTEEHLQTLQRYNLLTALEGQTGITEDTLERLRLHTRALLESTPDDPKLIELAHDVIFHDNMKAVGLANLIAAASRNGIPLE